MIQHKTKSVRRPREGKFIRPHEEYSIYWKMDDELAARVVKKKI